MSCCVVGCKNRYSKQGIEGMKFYRIPRGSGALQTQRRRLWLQAIKRVFWAEDGIDNLHICGAHFISGQASMDSESPDFVPSIFTHAIQRQRPEAKMERYLRKKRRENRVSKSPIQPGSRDNPQRQVESVNPQRQVESVNISANQVLIATRTLQNKFRRLLPLYKDSEKTVLNPDYFCNY